MKLQHLKKYLNNAKSRAKRDGVPFNLTLQDLIDIATDECPIFHTKFVWGASGLGKGKTRDDTPQLDKIFPELGYVKDNIAFLSAKANKMKDNGTMQNHYDIANWIWSHTHAKEIAATPVSAGDYIAGAVGAELGSVSTPWTWEDDNDPDNHCGTIHWEDFNYRTKASSGDSVGRGGQEVETPVASEGSQTDGLSSTKIVWIADRSGHLPDKP